MNDIKTKKQLPVRTMRKGIVACNDNYIGLDEYEAVNTDNYHLEIRLNNRMWNERNYFED